MRKTTIIIALLLMLSAAFDAQIFSQSYAQLSDAGETFQPANSIELLETRSVSALPQCDYACHLNVLCRTFDYDSSSLVCRLFEGALSTGDAVPAIPTSRVGSLQYPQTFFAAFGQPCSQCKENRYLTCSNKMCQCHQHSFWNGSQCENQRYENASCLDDDWCRNYPLGLICSLSNVCTTFNVNLLTNGDAETGPCEAAGNVTHPTGWQYNGTITQVQYNNLVYGDLSNEDPGPSDRGQCYFFGQMSAITLMWQIINLTNVVNSTLVDNQSVWFNLSAWIGGYQRQDDNAQVSLAFANQASEIIGNSTTIGPVFAIDRSSQTSLLFRQANGRVPASARFLTVLVTITRTDGLTNDGDVDNIAMYLYQ